MSPEEFGRVAPGLYLVYWWDDPEHPTPAAIGRTFNGLTWLAPVTWAGPVCPSQGWEFTICRLVPINVKHKPETPPANPT